MRPGKPENVSLVAWRMGDAFLPISARDALDKSVYSMVNGWSIVHFLSGCLLAMIGATFDQAQLIHFVWEMFQISIGMTQTDDPRELIDISLDTLFFTLGFSSLSLRS